jgi:2-oxoglutarate dehydrogenase E2 component (dihydrolipoamide succinyltransferase)
MRAPDRPGARSGGHRVFAPHRVTMLVDIIIPEMGESVRTGVVSRWLKGDGDFVQRDQPVMELETDKITTEIVAPAAGRLKHLAKVGQTVKVGAPVGQVDDAATGADSMATAMSKGTGEQGTAPAPAPTTASAPGTHAVGAVSGRAQAPLSTPTAPPRIATDVRATALARKLAEEHGVDLATLTGTGPGGRIREQDVLAAVQGRSTGSSATERVMPNVPMPAAVGETASAASRQGGTRREPVSPLRARIAERLVAAQHTAAMLTTFNEVDMTGVIAVRTRYREEFEKRHGVALGFMSFFVKAAANALRQYPVVNAYLVQGADGGLEIEYHDAAHIAVAVSTPKGLTVPVIRNVDAMSFAQIESTIKDLATRAREGKLTLDELQGGTFTITNGGIFGSLLSTPILNPPQTAILGMHAIKNRPVENPEKPGEIVLRPMMYLALSYDHRLLDGSEAVSFLVAIKNAVEHPERLLLQV